MTCQPENLEYEDEGLGLKATAIASKLLVCAYGFIALVGIFQAVQPDPSPDENYRGIGVYYQIPKEQVAARTAVDYLLSKEPYRSDSKRLKGIIAKQDLRVKGVSVWGYADNGFLYLDADNSEIRNTAAHELGHVVHGPSESKADAYAGLPHDFSKWASTSWAVP